MPQDFFETTISPMGVACIYNYRTGNSPIIAPNGSLVLVQPYPEIGIYSPGMPPSIGSYCKVMLSIGANTITASYLNDIRSIYVGGRPGAIEFSETGLLRFFPQIYGNQGGDLTTQVEFDIYGSASVTAAMSRFRFTLDLSYSYYFASSYSSPAHLCHCVFYPTTGRLTVDTSTCPHLAPNDPDDQVIPTKYEVFVPFRLKSQDGVYRYVVGYGGAYSGTRIYSSYYESAPWPDPINDPHPDLGWVIDSFENETNQWGTAVRSVTKDGVTYYRDFSQPSIAERYPPVFPS